MKQGIDVSYAQKGFDFKEAERQGIEFAICRLSWGDHSGYVEQDEEFVENINGAIDAGIKVGVYHFFGATNPGDARLEAEQFISLYKSLVTEGITDDVGIWLDVEGEPGQVLTGVDMQTLTDSVSAFIVKCNEAGINIGIYANYDWLENHIDVSQLADYVCFWLSELDDKPCWKYEHPEKNVSLWQYSFTGNVGGIDVDLDMMF